MNKSKNYDEKASFLNKFNMLRTTKRTAEILSDLKIKYDLHGKTFSLADLYIASQVIENNLVLITLDKDFSSIEELNKINLD